MHRGKEAETTYTLFQTNIKSTNLKKDLGFIIDNKLTFSDHTDSKVKKANQMLGIFNRTFSFMDKDMFTILLQESNQTAFGIRRPYLVSLLFKR